MFVYGHPITREALCRRFRCRRCRSKLGKPYVDPSTGNVDDTRVFCYGDTPHEIHSDADIIAEDLAVWLDKQEAADLQAVIDAYPWLNAAKGLRLEGTASLYGEDDFDGFD